jgi:hypothetical protein
MATAEDWKGRVAEWKALGISARLYCEPRGLSVSQLRSWAWELGMTTPSKRGSRKAPQLVRLVRKAVSSVAAPCVVSSEVPTGVRVLVAGFTIDLQANFNASVFNAAVDALTQRTAKQ